MNVTGQLKEPTGAPFSKSKVELRKRTKGEYKVYRSVMTDQVEHFDLGMVPVGKYRFLPGPNRGWKQPQNLICSESRSCSLHLVLQLNSTDQPFAACPIK